VKDALSRTAPEDRARWSLTICDIVTGLQAWVQTEEVLLYSPMPVEVDTLPLLSAAQDAGKRIYLPRLHGDGMKFHSVTHGPLEIHSYGMKEPPEDSPCWREGPATRPSHLCTDGGADEVLMVCPGLAFDKSGRRLGRGKAFYDRFIARLQQSGRRQTATLVGVCFGVQLVTEVPAGPHDRMMDGVVTEQGFHPADAR
jgi:5-formyltetrahydrofolate cyclo-ligase